MLESVTIKGYRCFAELDVAGLTRVNVLVGKNNAGKTSLLEALELLLLRGQPDAIIRSSWRRQEVESRGVDPANASAQNVLLDVRQLFHGRQLVDGTSFVVEGKGGQDIIRAHVSIDSSNGNVLSCRGLGIQKVRLQGNALPAEQLTQGQIPDRMIPPIVFVSTISIDPSERVRLWDLVVGNESEDFVTAALQILEPNIDRVIFTVGGGHGGAPAAFVRMKGMTERVPLGNLGHGASRLFDLALLMVQARGGAFLVDEIEIGLHHSAMESVWRLIVENARRLDLQVFTTTHSQDCLRALANLYRDDRSLADTVSLHRLDVGAPRTERFSMDDVEVADEALLELRGAP